MYYSSQQIANFFIKKSHASGIELTPMKLLKLCYIAHGWHLGLYQDELLNEVIRAWKYGPVINSIYHDFKHYYNNQITELYTQPFTDKVPFPDDEKLPFLEKIWDIYKGFNGVQLSTMTHQKDTPWDITWNQKGGKDIPGAIIPNDVIKDYYQRKIDAVKPKPIEVENGYPKILQEMQDLFSDRKVMAHYMLDTSDVAKNLPYGEIRFVSINNKWDYKVFNKEDMVKIEKQIDKMIDHFINLNGSAAPL